MNDTTATTPATRPMLDQRVKPLTLADAAKAATGLKATTAKAAVKAATPAKVKVSDKDKAKAAAAKAKEKAAADKAKEKAKADKAKEKAAADKAKAKEKAAKAPRAPKVHKEGDDSRLVPAHLELYHVDKENKTAGGHASVDSNDKLAASLRGKDISAVYKEAAKVLKEPEAALIAKYKHLNLGMQRMNLGNRMRAAHNKAVAAK